MVDYAELEQMFKKYNFNDFKWIKPHLIVVSQWVRMKCLFGCPGYGKGATCPPNAPSVEECERFFREYTDAVIFHFEKKVDRPEDRHAWTKSVNLQLNKLEKEVFLAGHPKTFLLYMGTCGICDDCAGVREKCKNPKLARPAPEAFAVDVFATVKQCDYPIKVLDSYDQVMNRYALLLVQ